MPGRKGVMGIEGAKARVLQNPSFAQETDDHSFSQLIKRSGSGRSAQRNPKYDPKIKDACDSIADGITGISFSDDVFETVYALMRAFHSPK